MRDGAFGVPVERPPYRGRVHPDFAVPAFIDAVASMTHRDAPDVPGRRILLEGRNTVVAVPIEVPPGRMMETVIKKFRTAGLKKLRTLWSSGKAVRAWRGAVACLAAGVPTPLPLAYLERRRRGLVVESLYASAFIPEAVEIRGLFRELEPPRSAALIASLAPFLAACHNAGILHRDLSDGNILVRGAQTEDFEFFLIDTNRIRPRSGRPLSSLSRARNLVRLGVPAASRAAFLDDYPAKGRFPCLFRFWYRLSKAAYAGLISFRKALRLKRIAEALRIQ